MTSKQQIWRFVFRNFLASWKISFLYCSLLGGMVFSLQSSVVIDQKYLFAFFVRISFEQENFKLPPPFHQTLEKFGYFNKFPQFEVHTQNYFPYCETTSSINLKLWTEQAELISDQRHRIRPFRNTKMSPAVQFWQKKLHQKLKKQAT